MKLIFERSVSGRHSDFHGNGGCEGLSPCFPSRKHNMELNSF